MRTLALISLLSLTTSMSAQRMFSSGPHFAAPHAAAHSSGFARPAGIHGRGGYSSNSLYPFGLFSDSFYSDYSDDAYATGYPVAAEPPVILLQNAPAAAATPERAAAPTEPLMIELRGNRYVRISGEDNSNAQMIDREMIAEETIVGKNDQSTRSRPEGQSALATSQTPARDQAPVDLVFRDGHREQISTYTIADGILYTAGDYYANGSWNRKIELKSLNLPETINSNRSHGMTFRLPAAPNEVIVRP
jgi:hypothetical protein